MFFRPTIPGLGLLAFLPPTSMAEVLPPAFFDVGTPLPHHRSPGGRAHRRWRKRRAAGRA